MDRTTIVSDINALLHITAGCLANWLDEILPRVTDSWWEDCVLSSLSYSQREVAENRKFSKLSDFDLAALLRIADKSWYDMRTVAYLPTSERECVRDMVSVRNNWAHCSADLPDKDTILRDLKIILKFAQQVNCEHVVYAKISELTAFIEKPGSIAFAPQRAEDLSKPIAALPAGSGAITQNSLVCLVSDPQKRGFVVGIAELGGTTKYSVFIDNAIHTYYTGQIAPVVETADYQWIDVNRFRNLMTAYQINNPSGQNL